MIQQFLDLPFETKVVIITQFIGVLAAAYKAFQNSKKASFFEKAHEAVVVGIEHSNCDECREAAREQTKALGIEAEAKVAVKAVKENIP